MLTLNDFGDFFCFNNRERNFVILVMKVACLGNVIAASLLLISQNVRKPLIFSLMT
jgi:hypothetical protein